MWSAVSEDSAFCVARILLRPISFAPLDREECELKGAGDQLSSASVLHQLLPHVLIKPVFPFTAMPRFVVSASSLT